MAGRLRELLGADLLGVDLLGSLALGGFEPGRSDLDVAGVVGRALSEEEKREVVARVRHEALPCPVRKLELVVYRRGVPPPAFELNLNTGARELHVAFAATEEEARFWFVVDVAIGREHGVPLVGPPPRELLPALPRWRVLAALRESIGWALEHAPSDDLVLNAARAWRFAEEGVWSSKDDAGVWALERAPRSDVVTRALALRRGEQASAPRLADAVAFARATLARLEA